MDKLIGVVGKIARLSSNVQLSIRWWRYYKSFGPGDAKALKQELKELRKRNLKKAEFEEKVNLVAMLGIEVYPSEDLRHKRIACLLNLQKIAGDREQGDFAKVVFGRPHWKHSELVFEKKQLVLSLKN